jgi:adenylylsulfate kinase-like enzyme
MDREDNIRRIGAVAQIPSQTGIIAMTAFISPYLALSSSPERGVCCFKHLYHEAFLG